MCSRLDTCFSLMRDHLILWETIFLNPLFFFAIGCPLRTVCQSVKVKSWDVACMWVFALKQCFSNYVWWRTGFLCLCKVQWKWITRKWNENSDVQNISPNLLLFDSADVKLLCQICITVLNAYSQIFILISPWARNKAFTDQKWSWNTSGQPLMIVF